MVDNRLPKNMIGGSFKFSDLEKKKRKTKKKKGRKMKGKSSKVKGDPSKLGYPSKKTNLNIIMKGEDGYLYKNTKYKKTKRWSKVMVKGNGKKAKGKK